MKLLKILLDNADSYHVWDKDWSVPEGESPILQKHRHETVWIIGDDGEHLFMADVHRENFSVHMWKPRSLDHILDTIEALRHYAFEEGLYDTEVIRVRCEGRDGVLGMILREASD